MAIKSTRLTDSRRSETGFFNRDRSSSTENFIEKTRFLRPEICEYLSQKSGKSEVDLGKTESLTTYIEI
ncbi:hypothetical protein Osc7112_6039 [Oscillatoria nigro-viridis PCC 7112]|uniref:Uncharacterized protein n=1 Tax=Phormidium nigroviride PCC 7112 TaxID=179408 RepID=K9VQL4_9CYAN|nr:hypothetical protein Osc7112_6039 [Oscillatoria nigro-viridis PCC 7112]